MIALLLPSLAQRREPHLAFEMKALKP